MEKALIELSDLTLNINNHYEAIIDFDINEILLLNDEKSIIRNQIIEKISDPDKNYHLTVTCFDKTEDIQVFLENNSFSVSKNSLKRLKDKLPKQTKQIKIVKNSIKKQF